MAAAAPHNDGDHVYLMSATARGGWIPGLVYIGEILKGTPATPGTPAIPDYIIFHDTLTPTKMVYTDKYKGYVEKGLPIRGERLSQERLSKIYNEQNRDKEMAANALILAKTTPLESLPDEISDAAAALNSLKAGRSKRSKHKKRNKSRKTKRRKLI